MRRHVAVAGIPRPDEALTAPKRRQTVNMIPYTTVVQLANALRVLTHTLPIADFLRTHDPMALQQADRALTAFDVAQAMSVVDDDVRLVDARRHYVHDAQGGGGFVANAHYAQHVVGDVVTHDVAAPGCGHVRYRIIRVDDQGAWGVVVSSTVRDLTAGEVA